MKNLTLVTLVAFISMLGLSSCSNDDNATDSNKIEVTYQMRFKNNNMESASLKKIVDTYYTACGISASAQSEEVTVRGADRNMCDSTFAKMVKSANDKLSGINWEDTTMVMGFAKGETDYLFSITYAPAENGSNEWSETGEEEDHYYFKPVSNGDEYDKECETPFAMADVHVESSKTSTYLPYSKCFATINLNSGNSGDYVYITYKYCRHDQKPVTDLIAVESTTKNPETSIRYASRTYYICDSQDSKNDKKYVSLNEGNNGTQYYLYYTTDNVDGGYLYAVAPFWTEHYKYWEPQYDKEGIDPTAYTALSTSYVNDNKFAKGIAYIFNETWTAEIIAFNVLQVLKPSYSTASCCTNKGAYGLNIYLLMPRIYYNKN